MSTEDPAERHNTLPLGLALASLLGALAERGPLRCASVLDEAARFANHAPRRVLAGLDAPASASIGMRFEAARALNSLCAACAECPRGKAQAEEPLMAGLPPESPA